MKCSTGCTFWQIKRINDTINNLCILFSKLFAVWFLTFFILILVHGVTLIVGQLFQLVTKIPTATLSSSTLILFPKTILVLNFSLSTFVFEQQLSILLIFCLFVLNYLQQLSLLFTIFLLNLFHFFFEIRNHFFVCQVFVFLSDSDFLGLFLNFIVPTLQICQLILIVSVLLYEFLLFLSYLIRVRFILEFGLLKFGL